MENVIGVDQQHTVVGIFFCVGLKGGVFVLEHLNPAVRHSAGRLNRKVLCGFENRRSGAAAYNRRPRSEISRVAALRAPRSEFHNRSACRRADYPVSLCCYKRLMVNREQQHSFNHKRLHCRTANRYYRLMREDRRSLGNRPYIAGKLKVREVFDKRFVEKTERA